VHRDLAELPASPASRDNLVNPADSGGASKPIQASGMAFDRSPPAHHPGITTKVLRTKDIHKQNHRLGPPLEHLIGNSRHPKTPKIEGRDPLICRDHTP